MILLLGLNIIQWIMIGFAVFSLWFCYKCMVEDYWESKSRKQLEEVNKGFVQENPDLGVSVAREMNDTKKEVVEGLK